LPYLLTDVFALGRALNLIRYHEPAVFQHHTPPMRELFVTANSFYHTAEFVWFPNRQLYIGLHSPTERTGSPALVQGIDAHGIMRARAPKPIPLFGFGDIGVRTGIEKNPFAPV
jgi:hypothetical protein